MKWNPRYILYSIIIAICVASILAVVFVQVFKEDSPIGNIPLTENETPQEEQKRTMQDVKDDFQALLTNELLKGEFDDTTISKIDSTKPLVYSFFELEEETENYEMNIHLPAINIQGDTVKKYNNNTQNVFVSKAQAILENATPKTIYTIDYVAHVYEDIVSIVIKSTLKENNNAQRVIIQTYNYNLKTGANVTIGDMINLLGINKQDANAHIQENILEANREAEVLNLSGYNVFTRDVQSEMYDIDNTSNFFLDRNGTLYILYAYGNKNFTSELDIVELGNPVQQQ